MTICTQPDPNRIYAAHRTGELIDFTNPLTYSLLEKIFGYEGPYRSVLNQFHVGNPTDSRSYLRYIHGRVYVDVEIESEILWQPTLSRLQIIDNQIQPKFTPDLTLIAAYGLQFIQKSIQEFSLLSQFNKFVDTAYEKHQLFGAQYTQICKRRSLSVTEFLQLYQHTVYISYLYNLLLTYHPILLDEINTPKVSAYLKKYDQLTNPKTVTLEFHSLAKPFELDSLSKLTGFDNPPFADPIPICKCAKNKWTNYKVTLQVLKNNLRVQINVLLTILSYNLTQSIPSFFQSDLKYLTVNEVQHFKHLQKAEVSSLIEKRKECLKKEKLFIPSDIILKDNQLSQFNQTESKKRTFFQGIPCSKGIIEGPAFIVNAPKDTINPGIAIFENASPEYALLFRKAQGLVFKIGSRLSHGAIVAREMKKPAVVINDDLSNVIGKKVRLDGSQGTLEVIND